MSLHSFDELFLRIYSNDFNVRLKFIFDMYDFNKDSLISKEDVLTLLSSVSIVPQRKKIKEAEGKFTQEGGGLEEYNDREESQEQLRLIAEDVFKNKEQLSLSDFKEVTENAYSDIFLCLYSFIRNKLPKISDFQKYYSNQINQIKTPKIWSKVLASPQVLAKFSPISKIMKYTKSQFSKIANLNLIEQTNNSSEIVLTYSEDKKESKDDPIDFSPVINLIQSNANIFIPKNLQKKKVSSPQMISFNSKEDESAKLNEEGISINNNNKIEGFVYIQKKSKSFDKFWMVLQRKILYLFTENTSKPPTKLITLVKCFYEEASCENIENIVMQCFSLVYNNRAKKIGVPTKEEFLKWSTAIKKEIGYASLLDY